jgi:NDP-sugar pyrophosphorylase family protein
MPIPFELPSTIIKATAGESAAITRTLEELSPTLIAKLDSLAVQIKAIAEKPTGAYIEFDEIPKVTNSILEAGKLKGPGIEINNAMIGSGFEISGPSRIAGTEIAPVKIGSGVSNFRADAGVHIGEGTTIGYDVGIGEQTSLRANNLIGDKVQLGNNVEVGSRVLIADRTLISDEVKIGTKANVFNDVEIGENALIGRGSTIGPNSRIGPRVTVGTDSNLHSFVTLTGRTKVGHHAKIEANVTANKSFIGPYSEIGLGSNLHRAQIRESYVVPRGSQISRSTLK